MVEDRADGRRRENERQEAHPPAAGGAREHVEAEGAPHQFRPAVVAATLVRLGRSEFRRSRRRWLGRGRMIDVDRPRFRRQAVSDHAGAPRRVRGEHAMIDEQIGPRLRHERRQPSDELARLELEVGRAVGPLGPQPLARPRKPPLKHKQLQPRPHKPLVIT